MPCPPRSSYLADDRYYHVISRSINLTPIFRNPEDFARVRTLEREAKHQFPICRVSRMLHEFHETHEVGYNLATSHQPKGGGIRRPRLHLFSVAGYT